MKVNFFGDYIFFLCNMISLIILYIKVLRYDYQKKQIYEIFCTSLTHITT